MFIANQSAQQLSAKVDRIEGSLAHEVRQLADARDRKVLSLRRAQRKETTAARTRFDTRIADLRDEGQALRKKLAKTTNPAKRALLTEEISDLTTQIGDLALENQRALDAIISEYADRIVAVQARCARLVREADVAANTALKQARASVKRKHEARNAGARSRKIREIDLANALHERGMAAIDEMPERTT